MAAKSRQYALAVRTFKSALREGIAMDVYVYNALLDCHARALDARAFDSTWAQMASDGFTPNAASYSAFAKLLSRTDPRQLYALLHELRESDQLHLVGPSVYTLLYAAAAADSGASVEFLLSEWHAMRRDGVHPNQYLLSAFIAACAEKADLQSEHVEAVFSLVADFRAAGNRAEVGAVTNLLTLCARNGYGHRVLDIWVLAAEVCRLRAVCM